MKGRHILWLVALATLATGCHRDMWLQPKARAQRESTFFADGQASRPRVPGTLSTTEGDRRGVFNTGYEGGRLVQEMPVPVTEDLIKRGQERYTIFCSHCHGAVGDGQGMIAKRGLQLAQPVGNYHTDRLRDMPDGHFFDVITNGTGVMYPFSDRIPAEDRWAIVSYIRVLQLSQAAPKSDLDPETRGMVENPPEVRKPTPADIDGHHGDDHGDDHSGEDHAGDDHAEETGGH